MRRLNADRKKASARLAGRRRPAIPQDGRGVHHRLAREFLPSWKGATTRWPSPRCTLNPCRLPFEILRRISFARPIIPWPRQFAVFHLIEQPTDGY
jgi:hypothetical protein